MKRITLFLLSFMAFSFGLMSQTKYYKEFGKSRIIDQAEFDQIKDVLIHKNKSKPTVNVNLIVVDETRRNDSLVIVYKRQMVMDGGVKINLSGTEKVYEMVGKKFPNFKLHDLEGNTCSSDSLLNAPLVLNFWFNGCRPCKKEMPVLNQIKKEYEGKVRFVSITFNSADQVKKVLQDYPFDFYHLVEGRALIDQIGITAYPKTIVIDRNGIVRQVMGGVESVVSENGEVVLGDGDEIRNEIEKVLKLNLK
ncbi:TlpA disulfide reductase family protein [Marinifilum sp. D714]|uniref:TlpA family protein disulfide reductase n=1 Tax=Marinifilum sp. D714 TaxID=2937523 RepID=UPI0027BFEA6E|nr:TlpA disulfide reductase family protein [Marinifilum sp. D714]MDQ2178040.1 TlpA family protein disulfide reductase [Marinifilum sp. D714]